MTKRKRVALYARVSKALDQDPENQLKALREWAKGAGVEVEGEYIDETSSRDTRPQKEEILRKLRLGVLDGVAFWSLDRWGRTMSELILELEEASQKGFELISVKEGLRYDTATGKLHAHIIAAFADYERERIRERTLLGLARVRAQGKHVGRPKGAKDKKKRKRRRNKSDA
jgi:DNA invertase Pin-like site-specific DNA recombinase